MVSTSLNQLIARARPNEAGFSVDFEREKDLRF